jgi:hypothetical protein
MPNLKPPVTTTARAVEYREEILRALPPGSSFEPLMTLYLTDNTSPEEIKLASTTSLYAIICDSAVFGTSRAQEQLLRGHTLCFQTFRSFHDPISYQRLITNRHGSIDGSLCEDCFCINVVSIRKECGPAEGAGKVPGGGDGGSGADSR